MTSRSMAARLDRVLQVLARARFFRNERLRLVAARFHTSPERSPKRLAATSAVSVPTVATTTSRAGEERIPGDVIYGFSPRCRRRRQ